MPPSIDISADIVEIYEDRVWKPITKRGKLPGAKQVYRKRPGLNDIVTLLDNPGSIPDGYTPLLRKYIENGKLLVELPSLEDIRRYVLEQLREVGEPNQYEVISSNATQYNTRSLLLELKNNCLAVVVGTPFTVFIVAILSTVVQHTRNMA